LRASIDERVDHQWMGSYLVEQRRNAVEDRIPPYVVPDSNWSEAGFCRWYREHRPQVIISQHEEVVQWLAALGVQVPGQAGFVHLNCPDRSGRFAGIFQNAPDVGAAAVDFLVAMVQRNERGVPDLPHSILVDGTWQEGATLSYQSPNAGSGPKT
jgi:hypothetical protein